MPRATPCDHRSSRTSSARSIDSDEPEATPAPHATPAARACRTAPRAVSGGRAHKLLSLLRIYGKMLLLLLLRRPYKLTFLVSGSCNLRCRICSIWRHRPTYITLAEVEHIWDSFRWKPTWINISGGEPTLNPELSDILRFFLAMKRPLLLTLTTNGYRSIAEQVLDGLAANRRSLLYVSVSIDGEEPQHNAARGRADAFERTMRHYRALCVLQRRFPALKVGVSTTVSRSNYDRVLPFLERYIADETPVSINLAQSSPYYRNTEDHAFGHIPARELIQLLSLLVRRMPKLSLDSFLKVSFLCGTIRWLQRRPVHVRCASIVSNVLVSSELDLMDCTLRFQPWGATNEPRARKLHAVTCAIRSPERRLRAIRARILQSGCEERCHSPCESYVHTIAALLSPWHGSRLVWRYLLVCLSSARRAGPFAAASGVRDDACHLGESVPPA